MYRPTFKFKTLCIVMLLSWLYGLSNIHQVKVCNVIHASSFNTITSHYFHWVTLMESSFFCCLPLQFDQPPWSSSRKTFRLPLVNHKVTVVELDSFGRGWNFELLISDPYSSVYILHIKNLKSLIWWTIQIYQTWHHVERFLPYVWISWNRHRQTLKRLTYVSYSKCSSNRHHNNLDQGACWWHVMFKRHIKPENTI